MALEAAAHAFRTARLRLPQPWSLRLGQLAYLPRLASGDRGTRLAFAEERLIEELIGTGQSLEGVGVDLSERVIEVPWVLRSLPPAPSRVLDVGTAFAPVVYKRQLVRLPQSVELVDLALADVPLPSHVADVRRLPFEDSSFDTALCVSTLEHVGMDNDHYGVNSGGGGDVEALGELGRVAAKVLVTVPAGADQDIGWLRQYTPTRFRQSTAQAGLRPVRLDVFAHDAQRGWCRSDEDSIGERKFGKETYAASAIICAELERV
jgi:hypothetical protein